MAEVSVRDLAEEARSDGFESEDFEAEDGAPVTRSQGRGSVSLGLEADAVERLDWDRALKRVLHDLRSDFIWAPHLRFLYTHAGKELVDELKRDLVGYAFYTRPVLSIEVPKSFRIQVSGLSKRLGPSFTRPGSTPMPKERLLYQVLADELSLSIEQATDRSRSFSHQLAQEASDAMFLSNRECWSQLQSAVRKYAQASEAKYILRLDIANYFESINLKALVAALDDIRFDPALSELLGRLMVKFSGGDGSRGIIQGVYPSDMLGMFYMNSADQLLDDLDIKSARYVDDLYIFVGSVDEADAVLRRLIPFLRSYGLNLNEIKSAVYPKRSLFSEEPDLEELFHEAVDEITNQLSEETSSTDYGFQRDWDDDEEDEEDEGDREDSDIELRATEALFASIDDFPGSEESIERFCLPLFAKSGSEFALNHVLDSLARRPSMTQIYAHYLAKFVRHHSDIRERLAEALTDPGFYDWQKMWLLACLMQAGQADAKCLKVAASLLADPLRHDALRAVAALLVGRYGDATRRRSLSVVYKSVSEYVQLAIFFASRNWPKEERASMTDTWRGHGPLHRLMAKGLERLEGSLHN